MGVYDGIHLRPGQHDIAMKSPLAGRHEVMLVRAIHLQKNDIFGSQLLIGHATGRDQQAIFKTHAEVSRGALIQPRGVHLQGLINDVLAQRLLTHTLAPFPGFEVVLLRTSDLGCPRLQFPIGVAW